jgi:prepilin-type N-terminal cleavage/methylation domain-containing protein
LYCSGYGKSVFQIKSGWNTAEKTSTGGCKGFLFNLLTAMVAKIRLKRNSAVRKRYGFTMVEVIVVVAILATAAVIAVPMFSLAGSMQIEAATNMIAADLEYAKSMAIGRGQNYVVVFDTAGDSNLANGGQCREMESSGRGIFQEHRKRIKADYEAF